MKATNHDSHKVFHDGHNNENVKKQRRKEIAKIMENSQYRKQFCDGHYLWPSWFFEPILISCNV